MSRDWRAESEALLLALEREQQAAERAEAADLLCELVHEAPAGARAGFGAVMNRLLTDAEPLVKAAGLAMAAALLPADEAEALFTRHLADVGAQVRIEAAGRLADLARPGAQPALAAALQDESPAVRFEAARGLAALKHPAGLEVLVAALGDSELCFRALSALAELEDPRALEPIRRLFRRWLLPPFERTQAAGALARLGDASGERHLLTRAAKRWAADRPMALELLGEVKAASALSTLTRVLEDPADLCRGSAARGLGRLGTPEAEAVLLRALATADDELQVDIGEGLVLAGTPAAVAAVAAVASLRALLDE